MAGIFWRISLIQIKATFTFFMNFITNFLIFGANFTPGKIKIKLL